MDDFKDSKTAGVFDVDCTTDGQALCEKHGVRGYPTIKWGDPSDLQDYDGGRSFDELKKFADENLGPTCGPDNLDLCDEADKAMIKKYSKFDIDELSEKIPELDAKITAVGNKAQKAVDSVQKELSALQGKVEKENAKKKKAIDKEKKSLGFNHMQAVMASKKKKEEPAGEAKEEEKKEE